MSVLLFTLGVNAQVAPGRKPGPVPPAPTGATISTSPPPVNVPIPRPKLGPVHTIKLTGATITVTATNKFTQAELRRWLQQAMMKQ